MTIREVERDLLRHPLIMREMGMQMQLGLPWLYCHGPKLCLSYRPHREVYRDDALWIYEAQYELELVYPSWHITRFVNLYFERNRDIREPESICVINGKWMIEEGRGYLDALYLECSRVIDKWKEDKALSALLRYQALYKETAAELGLLALYGEVRQNADCRI
ncbi:hypothetical protein GPL15_19055 [Clostridium sp. MCC353]|uniref:hypothetical protein n=1 Tax=Clostridium sp. MCC353 TaxID=2592646 RepID=UPI001C02B7E3|nr:hypothetical protein [Clostridium sp. MCC353]MBT9778600.1 hypothetical protein [Clostridium sp. MCC353]